VSILKITFEEINLILINLYVGAQTEMCELILTQFCGSKEVSNLIIDEKCHGIFKMSNDVMNYL